ncbi:galactokinase [Thalassobacillus devorans]|uniref:galactokinase n=1 Tax=Thalassobacillus devorans TaxID=279813 RepID=UPI00048CCDBE|nr:galactokinase [Thalassobacillus devorans]
MKSGVNLTKEFQTIFNTTQPIRTFFAPGRINLIGEHTDYNGGHVFPAAISYGTYALGAKRNDSKLRLYSLNFPETGIIECDLSELNYNEEQEWANYPKGIFSLLTKEVTFSKGADILFYGNIPNGAGLSSSASIELATSALINGLYNIMVDRIDMIKLGQKVENTYIGVNSGIMDQFSIGLGKQEHAILLNCDSLQYQYAPLRLTDHVIIIINTNKKRSLTGTQYNNRRKECERALLDLQKKLNIHSLGELSKEVFEHNKHLITNVVDKKRAKHVVYENARTLEAFDNLQKGDLHAFGQLLNTSHVSLRDDYEVTGKELDVIVETAWKQEGVLGARMTGAGFGGCAIALVEKEHLEAFKKNVNNTYVEKVGYEATFYNPKIGDNIKEISEGVLI